MEILNGVQVNLGLRLQLVEMLQQEGTEEASAEAEWHHGYCAALNDCTQMLLMASHYQLGEVLYNLHQQEQDLAARVAVEPQPKLF